MPVHNAENTVTKAINSVIKQDLYPNFELIIVNNGSSDSSEKICKQKATEDERIKYIYLNEARCKQRQKCRNRKSNR